MSTTAATQSQIVLNQCGQCVSFEPSQLQQIGGDLLGRFIVSGADDCHGYSVVAGTKSLLQSPEGFRLPNAGCLPALRFRGLQRGVDVRMNVTPKINTLPVPETAPSRRHSLVHFVREHERGMIKTHSRVKPAQIVAELAQAYPQQRIVVLCSKVTRLQQLGSQLSERGLDAVYASGSEPLSVDDVAPMPQLLLSTFYAVADAEFAAADIVLMLDAYECLHQRAQLALSQMDARFRLFGIAAADRLASPAEADMAMAVYGPEVFTLFAANTSQREVNVAWVTHQQPQIDVGPNDKRFYFAAYWQNDRRNRRLKQLATALRAGETRNMIRQEGVCEFTAGLMRSPRVTLLVERPLHAAALAKLLPDWDVVTGDTRLAGLPGSFRHRANVIRCPWTAGEQQIVLAAAASEFAGERSDIVIWAGGGAYIDAIPERWFHTDCDDNQRLLIADLDDRHHPTAQKYFGARQRAYYAREIFPVGVRATDGRIAMFLDARPKGDA